MLLMLLFNSQ